MAFPSRRVDIASVLGALTAIFVAPKLASDKWVYSCRMVFHEGHIPIASYHAPKLAEIVSMLAAPETIRPALDESNDLHEVLSELEVRTVPGSSFINLRLKWADKEAGQQLIDAIAKRSIKAVDEFRDTRIEAIATELNASESDIEDQIASQKLAADLFHEENNTVSVVEDLASARSEVLSLERELLEAEAERKGIDRQIELHASINESFNDLNAPKRSSQKAKRDIAH